MAELLVRAKRHWMDDWDAKKVESLTKQEKQSYDARSQIGDIIVVRGDGWKWGKEECPPNFIVVKIPQMTEIEAKVYEDQLWDRTDPEKPIMLKVRKHALPKTDVNNVISIGSVSLAKNILLNKIIIKVA